MSVGAWFLRPELLPWLGLLVPLVVADAVLDRRRSARLDRRAGPRAALLAEGVDPSRRRARRLLGLAGTACALLALAGPTWRFGPPPPSPKGADVVVCLDVSRSMLARDVAPTRLDAARREIAALAGAAAADRLALVLFAGVARVAAPLTRDVDAVVALARAADDLSVARGGTDLGAAVTAALDLVAEARGDHAAIVLLTDGEDLDGRGLAAAKVAAERGVVVHALAFGSERGSKIAEPDGAGESFVRDAAGADVVTRRDAESLRRLVGATGGEVLVAGADGASAAADLHTRRLAPAAAEARAAADPTTRPDRYQFLLGAALPLWALALGLSERRRA